MRERAGQRVLDCCAQVSYVLSFHLLAIHFPMQWRSVAEKGKGAPETATLVISKEITERCVDVAQAVGASHAEQCVTT